MKIGKKTKKIFPNFYQLFNIPFGASSDLIKKQYRCLAKIYHPDNIKTGSNEKFLDLAFAYKILMDEKKRKLYDDHFLKIFSIKFNSTDDFSLTQKIILEEKRIHFPNSIASLARHGLLRVGLRNKDRKKYSGIDYDVCLLIKPKEVMFGIIAKIPLTVRIICPTCLGSNIYCGSCNGKGNYKGTRLLEIILEPNLIVHNRVYEFELGRFRPDKFVHFKKKVLKVKLEMIRD